MHNAIEPFDRKLKTGEYYIDEIYITKYKTSNNEPVTIEAGFYARNLIDFILDKMYISPEDIKYQLVADRSIKHDAFEGYIKYVFDNFDEKKAKKIANQYIGYLGTKYDKSSQGFTTTSYQTACALWTEAAENNINVSINNMDNI